MNLSLGELEALCLKAARGAGFPWGLAEDTGRAVRWLQARGENGAGSLVALLEATDGAERTIKSGCPIAIGTFLSDCPINKSMQFDLVHAPELLAPFLDGMARFEVGEPQVTVTPETHAPSDPTHTRADLTPDTYARLDRFAQRTYAPATEASRLAGAGTGGLTDND